MPGAADHHQGPMIAALALGTRGDVLPMLSVLAAVMRADSSAEVAFITNRAHEARPGGGPAAVAASQRCSPMPRASAAVQRYSTLSRVLQEWLRGPAEALGLCPRFIELPPARLWAVSQARTRTRHGTASTAEQHSTTPPATPAAPAGPVLRRPRATPAPCYAGQQRRSSPSRAAGDQADCRGRHGDRVGRCRRPQGAVRARN